MTLKLTLVAGCALIFSACSDSGSDNNNSSTGTAIPGLADCSVAGANQAVICGKAVASDGVTPLSGAEIRYVSEVERNALTVTGGGVANPSKCVTDSSGDFACVLPEGVDGMQNLVIVFNGFVNYSFTSDAVLGSVTAAGTQELVADSSQKWLVVPGEYDGVQVLLAQLKNCTLNNEMDLPFDPSADDHASARSSADCTNKGLLVLDDNFANSSSAFYHETFLRGQDLQDYDALFINCDANLTDNDGPINTNIRQFVNSGKSVYLSDLSSDWLSVLYPNKINFLGNSTSTGTIGGDVTYPPLANAINASIDLVFDLGAWSAIDTVTSDVTTFIEADISSITSYNDVSPVTVGLKEATGSGCVFYTSYHIEGASTGAPQELAIKYLIQNINNVCI